MIKANHISSMAVLVLSLLSGSCSFTSVSMSPPSLAIAKVEGTKLSSKQVHPNSLERVGLSSVDGELNNSQQQFLPSVPMDMTPEVKKELSRYLGDHRPSIRKALKIQSKHVPVLKNIFKDQGLPPELVNLAMLESAFDPSAHSPAGARGLWQFMDSTAQKYGLKTNGPEDQRRDPILSTIAAAKHLRDLYEEFKDWYLAIAAYNAGPGAIARALQKSGKANFWALARSGSVKKETADFVPRFIASAIIMRNPENFGFHVPDSVG